MTLTIPTMVHWLEHNCLNGWASVYLHELEQVTLGIPQGPLGLAPLLRRPECREALLVVAREPRNRHWAERLHFRLQVESGPSARDAHLALADEAQVARRYRRSVQLYGWLALTAQAEDNAFAWSVHHLCALGRLSYAGR